MEACSLTLKSRGEIMYRKILVPLDGSRLSETILEHVKVVVTGCGIPPDVVLLNIVEPFRIQPFTDGTGWVQKIQKEAKRVAKIYLDQLVEKFEKDGITAEALVLSGDPGKVILEYAEKNNVDLIIMCSHARSGVARLVFGSVADKISRYSPVPVLVVTPPGLRLESSR
jgi:nucleotide-binding universal stress UspA family protein